MLGISQPQIHNLLKGARKLRPEVADRLIASLKMALVDLLETAELREQLSARPADENEGLAYRNPTGEPDLLQTGRCLTSAKKKPASREAGRMASTNEQAS